MMSFLKNFLNAEKTLEEKALLQRERAHDVLVLSAADAEACTDEEPKNYGGCCGGGCRQ